MHLHERKILVLLSVLSRWRFDIAALVLSTCSAATVVLVFTMFPHPPGGDPAQWLSVANLYRGQGDAGPGAYAYPPLYFLLLIACLSLFVDPVAALVASVAVIFFLLPLSCYVAHRLVMKNGRAALCFGALVGLGYPMYDMLSWGGYPNLLSFVFFIPAVALLIRASTVDAKRRDLFLLGIFASLVFLAHPLSSFLFAVAAIAYTALVLAYRRDWRWIKRVIYFAMPPFLATVLPYFAIRSVLSPVTPDYIYREPLFSLDLLLFPLVPAPLRGIVPFHATVMIALVIIPGGLTLASLTSVIRKGALPRRASWLTAPLDSDSAVRAYLLFVSTFLPPMLIPIGMWAAGWYTDYGRLMFYPYFPLAALFGVVLSRLLEPQVQFAVAAAIRRWLGLRIPRRTVEAAHGWVPSRRRARIALASSITGCSVAFAVFVASNISYLQGASQFYLAFSEEEDIELASWVRKQTQPGDLLLLSPDPENQRAVRWLEGLSGRRTVGYSPPRYLFYESERELNYEVLQMFNNRYAVTGGNLEVGTRGFGAGATYQLRFSVLDRLASYPAIEISDSSFSVMHDGNWTLPGAEWVPGGLAVGGDKGEPHILLQARDQSGNLLIQRTASVSQTGGRLALDSSGASVVEAYRFESWIDDRVCQIAQSPNGLEMMVRIETTCTRFTIGSETELTAEWNQTRLTITVSADPLGTATLEFGAPDAIPGFVGGPRTYSSTGLFIKNRVSHIVILRGDSYYEEFLAGAYGFPKVYENGKYSVLRCTLV